MSPRTLGAHTFGLAWDMDAAAAIRSLAERGFRAFELIAMAPHLDPRRISPDAVQHLRETVADVGSEILAMDLPSNDINIASTSPDLVDFTVETYLRTIRLAAELGSRWVVVLPGRRHGLLPPPDRRLHDILRGSLERLVREAERCKLRLLLENHPQTLLPDAPSIAGFLTAEKYGCVDCLYDVANGLAVGEDFATALPVLQPFLAMVHLSDSPKGQWKHDPIGSGDIDFRTVRETLEQLDYQGTIVTEIIAPGGIEQLVAAREALKDRGWNF